MTACVNRKHTKKVAAVVTASLVGALSLGVAPVAAMATDGIETQATVADDEDIWAAGTFTWNVDKGDYGYAVEPGDVFALESVQDMDGKTVPSGDYQVFYFEKSGNLVSAADSLTGEWGGMPKSAGDYVAVVAKVDAKFSAPQPTHWTWWTPDAYESLSTYTGRVTDVQVSFKVTASQKSIAGAFAYDNGEISDTTFVYTGDPHTYSFADADGEEIDPSNYDITWIAYPNAASVSEPSGAVTIPGTYTALLTGKGEYTGQATVTFNVEKLDFSKHAITVKTVANDTGLAFVSGAKSLDQTTTKLYADGDELNSSVLDSWLVSFTRPSGDVLTSADSDWQYVTGSNIGAYAFSVYPNQTNSASDYIEGGKDARAVVTAHVVDEIPTLEYDGENFSAFFTDRVFETSKNEAFDPELIEAFVGGDNVDFKYTVTKDGEAVADYTQPGLYVLTVDVPVQPDHSYGMDPETVTFRVASRDVDMNRVTVFATVDGKSLDGVKLPYTGEAVEPSIVVKEGKKVLDAADYTVTYKDEKGEAVESMVEPGEYTVTVEFPGIENGSESFTFEIVKAELKSAKAAQDLYAYTGETVTPDFVGYTGEELTGTEVALPNDGVAVKYTKTTATDANGNPDFSRGKTVSGSDVKGEGWYRAEITVASSNEHYTGDDLVAVFQISSYAKFSDVDSTKWYAQDVYAANELGYMTGIKGTDLFMPEAEISRAELSQVFANMAGEVIENIYTPTQFADVDAFAWYAEPIAWANEAGIVTGYDADTFGPMDKASREQVATMLYRYAKAQGKDVSVEDADAALAAYKDGDQVSDWAKTAMAWAVENGIFGVDTDELWANQNIQRAAVASIAVRFQPEALPEA